MTLTLCIMKPLKHSAMIPASRKPHHHPAITSSDLFIESSAKRCFSCDENKDQQSSSWKGVSPILLNFRSEGMAKPDAPPLAKR
jgi:hypothetical protein